MKRKTWDILDYGEVPEDAPKLEFTCENCGTDADLPHLGVAIAQVGAGIVFDTEKYAMPARIRCRACRRIFEL